MKILCLETYNKYCKDLMDGLCDTIYVSVWLGLWYPLVLASTSTGVSVKVFFRCD